MGVFWNKGVVILLFLIQPDREWFSLIILASSQDWTELLEDHILWGKKVEQEIFQKLRWFYITYGVNFPEKVQEKLDCVDFLNDFEKFVELSEDFVVIFLENDFLFCQSGSHFDQTFELQSFGCQQQY